MFQTNTSLPHTSSHLSSQARVFAEQLFASRRTSVANASSVVVSAVRFTCGCHAHGLHRTFLPIEPEPEPRSFAGGVGQEWASAATGLGRYLILWSARLLQHPSSTLTQRPGVDTGAQGASGQQSEELHHGQDGWIGTIGFQDTQATASWTRDTRRAQTAEQLALCFIERRASYWTSRVSLRFMTSVAHSLFDLLTRLGRRLEALSSSRCRAMLASEADAEARRTQ